VSSANDESELTLYQTNDGVTRIHVRLVDGSVWLTQRQLADLYQISVPTVSEHLQNIFAEDELSPEATVRKFRTVRTEGNRTISRTVDHYSLPVVLAVGYRVRSPRGTQFRRWATTRLEEYVVKGFTLDDERLKQPAGADYFDELLERIRDIRASGARVYQRIREIFALAPLGRRACRPAAPVREPSRVSLHPRGRDPAVVRGGRCAVQFAVARARPALL
jgi:hypothetical protein